MIRHDHECMQLIMPQHRGVVLDGLHNHVRDCLPAKMERTGAGFVEETIHRGKGLSGTDGSHWEGSIRRQTSVKTPGEEGCFSGLIEVRKTTAVEGHAEIVPQHDGSLTCKKPTRGSAADRGVRPTIFYAALYGATAVYGASALLSITAPEPAFQRRRLSPAPLIVFSRSRRPVRPAGSSDTS